MKFLRKNEFLVVFIFLLWSCSPKIAEIEGKHITIASFQELLKESDPKFFGLSAESIYLEFANWKKLKTLLTKYLDREAIFRELSDNRFEAELPLKEKQLLYWIVLGEYGSFLGVKESDSEVFLNLPDLEFMVQNQEKLRRNFLVLVWGKWSFDFLDIRTVLGESEKEEDWVLAKRIVKELFPKIRVAYQSVKRNLDRNEEFQNWWNLRWKSHLVRRYRQKVQKGWREEILSQGESELKSFYKENLGRFVYYTKGEKQPYQLSYTRSKEELVQIFLRKKHKEWIETLWNRYDFQVEESYFEELGEKELREYSKSP